MTSVSANIFAWAFLNSSLMISWGWFPRSKALLLIAIFHSQCLQCLRAGIEDVFIYFFCTNFCLEGIYPHPPLSWVSFPALHLAMLSSIPLLEEGGVFLWVLQKAAVRLPSEQWAVGEQGGPRGRGCQGVECPSQRLWAEPCWESATASGEPGWAPELDLPERWGCELTT